MWKQREGDRGNLSQAVTPRGEMAGGALGGPASVQPPPCTSHSSEPTERAAGDLQKLVVLRKQPSSAFILPLHPEKRKVSEI